MFQNTIFQGLTPSEIETFMLFTQERFVKSGEVLFREGDDAIAMYIVKEGDLKVYRERSTGEQILGHVLSGDMVGEMALFDNDAPKKRTATVQAAADSLLLVIVDYAIVDLSRKHPEIFAHISSVMGDRNRKNQNC